MADEYFCKVSLLVWESALHSMSVVVLLGKSPHILLYTLFFNDITNINDHLGLTLYRNGTSGFISGSKTYDFTNSTQPKSVGD